VTETLGVLVTQSTPLGSYNLTLTGIPHNLIGLSLAAHNLVVGLVVTAPVADFGITVSPSQLYVSGGACGNINVTVNSIGGFSSAVNLTLTGLPNHVSSLFTPNPITPPVGETAQSILTLCPTTTATSGNYTMVVAGTSSSTVHTVDAALIIPPPPPPPPFSGLIVWFVITMLLLGLSVALLVIALSKKKEKTTHRTNRKLTET
jgi:hypothetical protein